MYILIHENIGFTYIMYLRFTYIMYLEAIVIHYVELRYLYRPVANAHSHKVNKIWVRR